MRIPAQASLWRTRRGVCCAISPECFSSRSMKHRKRGRRESGRREDGSTGGHATLVACPDLHVKSNGRHNVEMTCANSCRLPKLHIGVLVLGSKMYCALSVITESFDSIQRLSSRQRDLTRFHPSISSLPPLCSIPSPRSTHS
jgi:hypothetical protein